MTGAIGSSRGSRTPNRRVVIARTPRRSASQRSPKPAGSPTRSWLAPSASPRRPATRTSPPHARSSSGCVSARPSDIEAEKQRAIAELRAEVADLALAAASRVVGESMTDERQRQLVQEFLVVHGRPRLEELMARRDSAARRYAEAAFQVGMRDGTLEQWRSELELAAAVAGDERALTVLANPAIPVERRAAALADMLGTRVGRTGPQPHPAAPPAGPDRGAARASQPSSVGSTTSARASPTPPRRPRSSSPRTRSGSSTARLEESTGGRIALDVEVDPSLLGGLVVRVGDRLIDGSVRGRLERLRNRLASGAF